MKLIIFIVLQSICTVLGMGLMHSVLDGRNASAKEMAVALWSVNGLAGIVLLLASFVLTTMALTFTRVSVFVPLSTGVVFLITLVYAAIAHGEKVSLSMTIGMALIVAGIWVVTSQQGK